MLRRGGLVGYEVSLSHPLVGEARFRGRGCLLFNTLYLPRMLVLVAESSKASAETCFMWSEVTINS